MCANANSANFRIPESEIIFPAGTDLRFRLAQPLTISGAFTTIAPPILHSEEERTALAELIRPLPFHTKTDKTRTPSDLTSVLYIGSQDALMRAFDAAGWRRSDVLSAQTGYGAMRAVVENQGYHEAPMSTLLLDGANPTFTCAKTLDTFFKRHHLRIYTATVSYHDLPIWTSTATHDSGIGFSKLMVLNFLRALLTLFPKSAAIVG